MAAIEDVVPRGRKRCLTRVNSDSNPGGVPRFPSIPGARGWAVGGCVLARGKGLIKERLGKADVGPVYCHYLWQVCLVSDWLV